MKKAGKKETERSRLEINVVKRETSFICGKRREKSHFSLSHVSKQPSGTGLINYRGAVQWRKKTNFPLSAALFMCILPRNKPISVSFLPHAYFARQRNREEVLRKLHRNDSNRSRLQLSFLHRNVLFRRRLCILYLSIYTRISPLIYACVSDRLNSARISLVES